jgi:hypothetical protein
MSTQTQSPTPITHASANLDDLLSSKCATITRAEAARVLELNKRTLDKGHDAGDIHCLRVGRRNGSVRVDAAVATKAALRCQQAASATDARSAPHHARGQIRHVRNRSSEFRVAHTLTLTATHARKGSVAIALDNRTSCYRATSPSRCGPWFRILRSTS